MASDYVQNIKIWIYTGLSSILLVTGLFLSLSKSSGFTLDAVKTPPNNRIQIIYSSPEGEVTAEPVTGMRLVTDGSEDEIPEAIVLRTSIFGDFTIDAESFGLSNRDIIYIHSGLSGFFEDDSVSEFTLSLKKNIFKKILGIVLLLVSSFFLYTNIKKLPDLTQEQKNELKARFKKIGSGAGNVKELVAKKIAAAKSSPGSSSAKAVEVDTFTEKLLMVLIIANNREYTPDTGIYSVPGVKSVTVACTEKQKADLNIRNITGINTVCYDKDTKESLILADFVSGLGDFSGYLIVESIRTNDITADTVKKLYAFHREKNNECSVLVREDGKDRSLPSVIRNMANRIVKISGQGEASNASSETDERFAGILCFNTNKIGAAAEKFSKLGGTGSVYGIIELYGKNGFKTNSFSPFQTEGVRGKEQKTAQMQSSGSAPQAKTCALIITSPDSSPKTLIKLTEAVSVPEIEGRCVICATDLTDTLQDMTDITVIDSNDDIGDGYDALKAHDWLKSRGGNVIVIPLNNSYAPDPSVLKKIIDLHYFNANTCTCVNHLNTPVVYCVKIDYFVYAVKRIIKDPDTKKYCLEQIVGILENDKKRVEILQTQEL